jgi:hypothetical protein
MTFIEAEIAHNKRGNLNLKEKRISEFIETEEWRHLFEGSSSTKREGT